MFVWLLEMFAISVCRVPRRAQLSNEVAVLIGFLQSLQCHREPEVQMVALAAVQCAHFHVGKLHHVYFIVLIYTVD